MFATSILHLKLSIVVYRHAHYFPINLKGKAKNSERTAANNKRISRNIRALLRLQTFWEDGRREWDAMPAKRMTATTATASSISGASGSTTNSNGPSGGGTRPLETLNGMTRLTPARDLTLGGRGAGAASKKVFAPNLNAVRNKNS